MALEQSLDITVVNQGAKSLPGSFGPGPFALVPGVTLRDPLLAVLDLESDVESGVEPTFNPRCAVTGFHLDAVIETGCTVCGTRGDGGRGGGGRPGGIGGAARVGVSADEVACRVSTLRLGMIDEDGPAVVEFVAIDAVIFPLDADHLPSTTIVFLEAADASALGTLGGGLSDMQPRSAAGIVDGLMPRGFVKGSADATPPLIALGPVGSGLFGSIILLEDAIAFRRVAGALGGGLVGRFGGGGSARSDCAIQLV